MNVNKIIFLFVFALLFTACKSDKDSVDSQGETVTGIKDGETEDGAKVTVQIKPFQACATRSSPMKLWRFWI